MTSGDDHGWRGGRSPRNAARNEEAQPSWKQSRNSSTGRKGRFRSRLKVLLAVLFLGTLVGTAIWLFRPARRVHTHFIVMNLLQDSADFDSATAVTIDDALFSESGKRLVSVTSEPSLSLSELSDPDSSSDLLDAQTVVISLQTAVVPDRNGELQCLVKNSTPDLNDENEWVSLHVLKDGLKRLQQESGPKNVLLIVDAPPTNAEWRMGHVTADLSSELKTWTADLEGLAVLLSCSEGQSSEYSVAGSGGQTVFSHFVSCGLSSLADSDGDKDLTAAEFCSYVSERTDRWVKQHRSISGQQVLVLPDLEKLRGPDQRGGKFLILRDVPVRIADDEVISPVVSSSVQSELAKLWSDREALSLRGGSRWNPLQWNSAGDALHRAETAMLRGQIENANRNLSTAGNSLTELEQTANAICPEVASLIADRGLVRSDFENLPSFGRIADLWETEPAAVIAASVAPALIEDVVAAQLGVFPFVAVGLTAPSAADLDLARSRRVQAETTVAAMMGCAWRMPATVRRMEAELLQSEDRRFTRSASDSATTGGEPDSNSLMAAVSDFTAVHDAAETTLSQVFETAPSLAFWCANAEFRMSVTELEGWRTLLSQNSVDQQITRRRAAELLDMLFGFAARDVPGFRGKALQLRHEAFRLLLNARGLQQSLSFSDPEPSVGLTVETLQQMTQELKAWQSDVSLSLRTATQLIEQTVTLSMEDSSMQRPEQLAVLRLLRASLCLSSMKAATRKAVVEAVLKRDAKLQEPDAAPTVDSAETPAVGTAPEPVDEVLWMLQLLNLIPGSSEQSQQVRDAEAAANSIRSAGSPVDRQKALAAFGIAVRRVWKLNLESVRKAVDTTSAEAHELLRLADQRARLFTDFDAQNPAVRSPTARLRLLNRLQYCVVQTDRLLAGQWVEATDKEPWADSGWYARASQLWLTRADECLGQLAAGSAGPPAFAVKAISDLRDRLQASEQLKVTASPEPNSLYLGEQNQERDSVSTKIARTMLSPMSGEASLLVASISASGPSELLSVENNATALSLAGTEETVSLKILRTGNPGVKDCAPVTFRTDVFFRGRRWTSPVNLSVDPCEPATFVVERLARPETATVTVVGSDPRPIVFILDWSDSMKDKLTDRQTTRAAAALKTLQTLIDRNILTDSRISLNVYGHRVKYNKLTRQHEFNQKYIDVFMKEISRRLSAIQDIETEFELRKADDDGKAAFTEILEKLAFSGPFGTTPLASAITDALTIDLKDKAGIVIAVTDGEATDVGDSDDPALVIENLDRQSKLKKAITDLPDSKAVIVAFDFKKRQTERDSLKSIFSDDCGIRIFDANDEGELLSQIRASLDPRSYSVRRTSETNRREEVLGNTVAGLLPADDYEISFAMIKSRTPVSLAHGDTLKLDIDHRRQRLLFLRAKNPKMKAATPVDSTAAVLADQPMILRSIAPAQLSDIDGTDNSELQKAELSLMLDHDRDDLPVRQPSEIEFFVRPAERDYRPPMIRQQYSSAAGAPGWLITIDEWPKDQYFEVDAVWKMQRSVPERIMSWDELKSADNPKAAKRIGGTGLPQCTVWTTLRDGGILQVRLDPVRGVTYPPDDFPEDIRIEIGNRDTLEQNASFLPLEINTRIRKTALGSVIFEFDGNLSPDSVAGLEVAFTSAAARKSGATEVRELRIEERR